MKKILIVVLLLATIVGLFITFASLPQLPTSMIVLRWNYDKIISLLDELQYSSQQPETMGVYLLHQIAKYRLYFGEGETDYEKMRKLIFYYMNDGGNPFITQEGLTAYEIALQYDQRIAGMIKKAMDSYKDWNLKAKVDDTETADILKLPFFIQRLFFDDYDAIVLWLNQDEAKYSEFKCYGDKGYKDFLLIEIARYRLFLNEKQTDYKKMQKLISYFLREGGNPLETNMWNKTAYEIALQYDQRIADMIKGAMEEYGKENDIMLTSDPNREN